MALIRQSAAGGLVKDAVVLNLGDLAAQGKKIKDAARAEADAILLQAKQLREVHIKGGKQEGYQAGFESGRQAGLAAGRTAGRDEAYAEVAPRMAALEKAWGAALDEFVVTRAMAIDKGAESLIELALDIASKVVKEAIRARPELVVEQVRAAMTRTLETSRVSIHVHPDDVEAIEIAMPSLFARHASQRHWNIVADHSLSRGSCEVVTAEGGMIDASVDSQLSRIARELLGRELPSRKLASPELSVPEPSDQESDGQGSEQESKPREPSE